jgi:hypothetical protein
VADAQLAGVAQMIGNLLRAPESTQALPNAIQLPLGESQVASGTYASSMGILDGFGSTVASVTPGLVALNLAPNSASVPAQSLGYQWVAQSLRAKSGESISLLRGDLVVGHGAFPFLAGNENLRLCQITSLLPKWLQLVYESKASNISLQADRER